MFVIKYKKIFYTLSAIIIAISLYGMFAYGLNFGIDFKGGAILEMDFTNAPDVAALNERVSLIAALSEGDAGAKVLQFDSVGPILGEELSRKAAWSIVWVIIAIVLFISFAFRKVSLPDGRQASLRSWKYGAVAIVALLHD